MAAVFVPFSHSPKGQHQHRVRVTMWIYIICGKCDLCSITTLKVAHCDGNGLLELHADDSKLALNIERGFTTPIHY